VIGESVNLSTNFDNVKSDIKIISMQRKSSVVGFSNFTADNITYILIHYNNGVTEYNENWTIP